jgi:NAD(P)-dependent dehydrogenase (short-subunit alcohol dehydrogenase family)
MMEQGRPLAGRTALVTGASSGIGRVIAERYARSGAAIVAHGRNSSSLDEVVTRCTSLGAAAAHALEADLAAPDFEADALAAAAFAVAPGIDVFVSCAGAYFDVPFLEMTPERFDQTWRLNVRAGYLLAVELVRRWHADGTAGRMIFIGSINGQLSEPQSTAYDISKAAIHGMVRTLCVELAPLGIRVNGLAPGLVRTAITRWLEHDRARAQWAALHTPSREVPPADVCAGAAVFLASDDAAHVHGHILNVDGGLGALQFPALPDVR